ncbi:MAG: hypothetical protein F6K11_02325 [Leptolyngbya sp. SIO3F4]|nr:hypothetical protein [Leptolyngbya sp. SIO3F4]
MAKKSSADLLQDANQRLKAGKVPVRIVTQAKTDRLYLRATLPPKSDATKQYPHQQRISLGVYCNPAGIKRAEAEAQKLNHELMLDQFNWSNWQKRNRALSVQTVSHWLAAFESDYFTRRERNAKSQTTWNKDYASPFNRLPANVELTATVLTKTAESYPPDTRSRKRACDAYSALARLAEIEIDLKPLRGKYRPTAVSREDVPSDELILAWCDRIPDAKWLNFYRLVACYGLRNHEAFLVDLEKLKADPIATVTGGKTGYRAVALPCPVGWWESWFEGQDVTLPAINAQTNSHYGNVSSQYFRRLDLPFRIYDLRHAHAGRMAIKGIDPAIAARSQGHSLKVHSEIYLNFLGAEQLRGLLDDLR